MGIKKILQKFFRGYAVLGEAQSPINGKIQVREDLFGKRNLVVGGISQSGNMVEKIWREILKLITNHQSPITNCLILGLGAGTAAKLINKKWPEAKIIGIEIDPEIIRLGKKYFGLDEIENLKLKLDDAILIINHKQSLSLRDQSSIINCDLILVDLYLGDQVPEGAETDEFLKNIRQCLKSSGLAIFNRLYFGKHKEKTDKFGEKLKKIFTQIEAKNLSTNKLFLCPR